jgi:predicted  nucleic acid-binding Zn-ribbon protein
MLNWIKYQYRRLRLPSAFRAWEHARRAEYEAEGNQKFSTIRLEARLLAANKGLEEKAHRRFGIALSKLQLEVLALEKQMAACRAQLEGFQRPFKDEFQLLEAEMSLLSERRSVAYAEKNKRDIEAVNAEIAELQRRINVVRSDMAVLADLRKQGITPEKLRRTVQRCETRVSELADEEHKLKNQRAEFMHFSPEAAEIEQIERDIAQMQRRHRDYLSAFDAPAERRRREREHEEAWLNGSH